MHGTHIAKKIVSDALNYGNVKSIAVEVGELSGMPAKELEDLLGAIANFNVNVKEIESFVECKCGYKGRAKIKERLHDLIIFCCPKCGKIPAVKKGDKIILKEVEIG